MCVLLYNPTFFDDLEGLKWGHLDHFGALRGLARRTDLGFWGPDLTKLGIQLIAQPFSFERKNISNSKVQNGPEDINKGKCVFWELVEIVKYRT